VYLSSGGTYLKEVCEPVALGVCVLHGEEDVLSRHDHALLDRSYP